MRYPVEGKDEPLVFADALWEGACERAEVRAARDIWLGDAFGVSMHGL
jgi:hypothetical protein